VVSFEPRRRMGSCGEVGGEVEEDPRRGISVEGFVPGSLFISTISKLDFASLPMVFFSSSISCWISERVRRQLKRTFFLSPETGGAVFKTDLSTP